MQVGGQPDVDVHHRSRATPYLCARVDSSSKRVKRSLKVVSSSVAAILRRLCRSSGSSILMFTIVLSDPVSFVVAVGEGRRDKQTYVWVVWEISYHFRRHLYSFLRNHHERGFQHPARGSRLND